MSITLPALVLLHEAARMAERYLYVPSIGFALLVGSVRRRGGGVPAPAGSGAPRDGARAAAPAIVAAIVIATALLGAQAFRRDRVWADEATFTRTWAREVPNDIAERVALGVAYAERGQLADAEGHARADGSTRGAPEQRCEGVPYGPTAVTIAWS